MLWGGTRNSDLREKLFIVPVCSVFPQIPNNQKPGKKSKVQRNELQKLRNFPTPYEKCAHRKKKKHRKMRTT